MSGALWALGALFFMAFGLIVFRGAPYVPTHKNRARRALTLLDLPAGATVIDLGSGDGVVLTLAAQRGLRAIGYELNPFLCAVAYLRCWRQRGMVTIRWRDFWRSSLPPQTDAVFVFLAGPYVAKFGRHMLERAASHPKPLSVVSYGFAIPGLGQPSQQDGDIFVYKLHQKRFTKQP